MPFEGIDAGIRHVLKRVLELALGLGPQAPQLAPGVNVRDLVSA